MKTHFLILSLFASMPMVNWSQTTLSVNETHRLFRGYDNKITLGSQGKKQNIEVVSNDVELIQKETYYIARPKSSLKTAQLFVRSTKSKDTLETYHFTIANLPQAFITVDGNETSKTISEKNKAFAVQLPSDFPIQSQFEIMHVEIAIQGAPRPLQFDGATFSGEFKSLLATIQNDTKVHVTMSVKDSQEIIRKTYAEFSVLHE
jgi:hypothetical protein